MKKFLIVAVMLAAILALALPAHSAGVVITTNAKATLPIFPGSGNVSSLSGTATGVGAIPAPPSGAITLGTGGVHYNENTCADGTANGKIRIGASPDLNLTWIRVGATAVLTLNGGGQTGAAAAVFEANTNDFQNDCVPPATPGQMRATIIAVGVTI